MDKKYVMAAFGYAILGLVLGIFMAMTKNHGQMVTHAHIMMVGFVLSFVYALCHKLWLQNLVSKFVKAQFYVHQLGAVIVSTGLFLFYGDYAAEEIMDPILGIGSILVLAGVVMMKIMFVKSSRAMA